MGVTSEQIYRPEIGELLREHLSIVVVRMNETGDIVYASPHAERMFGVEMTGWMVGKSVEEFIPVDKELRDKHVEHRKAFARLPRTRMMGAGMQIWGRKLDGTNFPVEISLIPAVLSGMETVTAVIYDMTGRVRARRDSDPTMNVSVEPSSKKKG